MLQMIEEINKTVNDFIWGVPAMICIIGVGLYLSIRAFGNVYQVCRSYFGSTF